MKKVVLLFFMLALTLLVGCNFEVKEDTLNQLTSINNSTKVDFGVNESKTDVTEHTENNNISQTGFNEQDSDKATNAPHSFYNERSSLTNIEIQNKMSPFIDVDIEEVKVLYKESKDVSGEFKEIKIVTDTSELQNIKNSLNQENWTYHSSSQGWGKFRPSKPNNRVVIIRTKQNENYVIHLYSDYDSNSFFLSVADYDTNMDYDEFIGLSDNEKGFERYSVSKNIYSVLLELFN